MRAKRERKPVATRISRRGTSFLQTFQSAGRHEQHAAEQCAPAASLRSAVLAAELQGRDVLSYYLRKSAAIPLARGAASNARPVRARRGQKNLRRASSNPPSRDWDSLYRQFRPDRSGGRLLRTDFRRCVLCHSRWTDRVLVGGRESSRRKVLQPEEKTRLVLIRDDGWRASPSNGKRSRINRCQLLSGR